MKATLNDRFYRKKPASATEHDVDAGQDQIEVATGEPSHAFEKDVAIQGDDLRCVRDRVLGKTGLRRLEEDIPGSVSPVEVARQRDAHDGGDPAAIERLTLHDDDRALVA